MSLLVSILIVIKLDLLMCFYLPCGCEQIPDKKQLKGGRFDFGLWSEGIQSIMEGKTWRWEVACSYLSRLGTREKLKKANTQLTFSFFFFLFDLVHSPSPWNNAAYIWGGSALFS